MQLRWLLPHSRFLVLPGEPNFHFITVPLKIPDTLPIHRPERSIVSPGCILWSLGTFACGRRTSTTYTRSTHGNYRASLDFAPAL